MNMEPTVIAPAKPEAPAGVEDVGRNGDGFSGGNRYGGGGGEPESQGWAGRVRAYRTGMWMALAAIVMLFAAFTSALVVRKGISNDWVTTAIPRILWLNTAVLIASSVALEFSRRSLAPGSGFSVEGFTRWLYLTLGLGLTFIAGQLIAWRELTSRGVYLSTNPSSSFFYLLTGAHGVHLLGGIAGLFYVVFRARRLALAPGRRVVVDVTALYWHFMDGLWVYILLLLTVRL
jgi:cytochrome c oxidase subunit 3